MIRLGARCPSEDLLNCFGCIQVAVVLAPVFLSNFQTIPSTLAPFPSGPLSPHCADSSSFRVFHLAPELLALDRFSLRGDICFVRQVVRVSR